MLSFAVIATALSLGPSFAMDQKTCDATLQGVWTNQKGLYWIFAADGKKSERIRDLEAMEFGVWGVAEGSGDDDCVLGSIEGSKLYTEGISFVDGKLKWGDRLLVRAP
jgi:hypothetical protein